MCFASFLSNLNLFCLILGYILISAVPIHPLCTSLLLLSSTPTFPLNFLHFRLSPDHSSLSFSLSASVLASSRSLGRGHATFNVFTARPHFESSQIPADFKNGKGESKLLIKNFCQYWTLVYKPYMYHSVMNCL